MIWSRLIIDGILLCIIFNAVVSLLWFIIPNAFSKMCPKDIREAAPPREKKEIAILAGVLYPLYIFILAYIPISAYMSGVTGFWNFFWTGYIDMLFVNFGDLFWLDFIMLGIVRKRNVIQGTEHCKSWQTKEWMKTALPEHLIFWPLILCSIAGFISAGIGSLLC